MRSPSLARPFHEPVDRSQCRVIGNSAAPSSPSPKRKATVEARGNTLVLQDSWGSRTYRLVSGPILDPLLTGRPRRIFWLGDDEVCVLDPRNGQAKRVLHDRGLSGGGRLVLANGTVFLKRINEDTCLAFHVTKKGVTTRRSSCPGT